MKLMLRPIPPAPWPNLHLEPIVFVGARGDQQRAPGIVGDLCCAGTRALDDGIGELQRIVVVASHGKGYKVVDIPATRPPRRRRTNATGRESHSRRSHFGPVSLGRSWLPP